MAKYYQCRVTFVELHLQFAVNLGCAKGSWQLAIDNSDCTILIKLPECQGNCKLQTANCQLQCAQNTREHTLITVSNFTILSFNVCVLIVL